MTAQELFDKQFKGHKNAMTPNAVSLEFVSPNVVVEITSGRGFLSDKVMYGVTVVCQRPDGSVRKGRGSNQCFTSRHEAVKHKERIARILGYRA